MIAPDTDIRSIKGIGDRRARLFEKLGICTAGDLIGHYPRAYEDRTLRKGITELVLGEAVCVAAVVSSRVSVMRARSGMMLCKTQVSDDTGRLSLTFFNAEYIRDRLKEGEKYVFFGRVGGETHAPEMINPVFEPLDGTHTVTDRILPLYPLTAGLTNAMVMRTVEAVLAELDMLPDFLPDSLRRRLSLAHTDYAMRQVHVPQDASSLEKARRRLTFEELFLMAIGLAKLKGGREGNSGTLIARTDMDAFYNALSFEPTGAQRRTVEEALADMAAPGSPAMRRLVQGDVGSGKTMVAAACMYAVVRGGFQCTLMAPTEILAEQHFKTLAPLFDRLGVRCELLTGATRAATRREVLSRLADGQVDILIGTHAVLTERVRFAALKLVVTDEQHRFGVRQRARLSEKGEQPHMLVMSATPIPRTLALILYGDLDLSVLDELPPGRIPVDTRFVIPENRPKVYAFMRRQFMKGRQAYVVCPWIDDDGTENRRAVERFAAELSENEFPDYNVAYLHGRMSARDKDAVMQRFAAGEIQLLVSTTVIEVGVDVPNASMMVIENAERFGLSQLHQLRGRVGRGAHRSYCVLFSESASPDTQARLQALCATTDGFEIAEADLRLRGPGDFFGARQSGLPALRVADLGADMEVLHTAQEEARALLLQDPVLAAPENRMLRERVQRMFAEAGDLFA